MKHIIYINLFILSFSSGVVFAQEEGKQCIDLGDGSRLCLEKAEE